MRSKDEGASFAHVGDGQTERAGIVATVQDVICMPEVERTAVRRSRRAEYEIQALASTPRELLTKMLFVTGQWWMHSLTIGMVGALGLIRIGPAGAITRHRVGTCRGTGVVWLLQSAT